MEISKSKMMALGMKKKVKKIGLSKLFEFGMRFNGRLQQNSHN